MKKLLFIFAAVVLAVGCTDKPEFKTPDVGTAQSLTLTYDTAQVTSATKMFDQTLNRVDDIYRVNGQYVKLTMYLNTDGVFYLTATSLLEDDEEAIADGKMLDCEIAKIEGDFSTPSEVNFKSVEDDEFTWQSDLPDATELQDPVEEQPENVSVYKPEAGSHPAYVLRYKVNEGDVEVVKFGFVFVVKDIELTETISTVEVPSGKPYVDPTTKEVPYYSNSVTLLYKAFDENGNWLN